MLTGVRAFDSLLRAERLCRHNLWRKKCDNTEILTDETYRYIQSHPEIIEIQHYLEGYVFEGNSTPTFNKDLGDSDFDEELAESVHSDFSDFSGNNASTLNTIQRRDMNVDDINFNDQAGLNDLNQDGEGDINYVIPPAFNAPPIFVASGVVEEEVIGFNGKPYKNINQGTEIFISNKNVFQITQKIDCPIATRFIQQCQRVDFRERIEDLISRKVWQNILIVALSKWPDPARQIELLHLKQYILRKPGQPYEKLKNDLWNDTTILQLIKDCFPRDEAENSMSNSIVARLISVPAQFDCNIISVELDTFFKINEILEDESEKHPLTLDEHKTVVKSWVSQWPSKTRNTIE